MRSLAMLALTQVSNYLNLKGSFSAVSKRNVASEYAQFFVSKSLSKIANCLSNYYQIFAENCEINFCEN